MCGRYVTTNAFSKSKHLVDNPDNVIDAENFNAYPTCILPVLLHRDKKFIIQNLTWGLVPKWAEGKEDFRPLNNARLESVDEKPSFKSLVKKYRCIIPADGYYEWQQTDQGKQPFFIKCSDDKQLYFGGLHQKNKDHEFTILTHESEGDLKYIHHRMPLMLDESQFDQFFDYDRNISSLTREQSIDTTFYQISKSVNSPKNNEVNLTKPFKNTIIDE